MIWRLASGLARLLPPEAAHRAAVRSLSLGIAPSPSLPSLPVTLAGLSFANPLGLAAGFDTPEAGPAPAMVLAEAGTGTGKTLGYLAPATLWAEANGAPVWISTYTRTLQHQIASELTRLYPRHGHRAPGEGP